MAVYIPTDILFAASQIIDDILDPAWAEDEDAAAHYVALAIVAERERCREALKPFADAVAKADAHAASMGFAPSFDAYKCNWEFSFGDLRRAREVYGEA